MPHTNQPQEEKAASRATQGGRKEGTESTATAESGHVAENDPGPLTPPTRKEPLKELKEPMSASNDNTQPLTAETANAIVNALGALVFATVRQLPADKQEAFAKDLARLAKSEEQQGNTATETILMDMHRAAVAAAS